MNKEAVLQKIETEKLIPVIRTSTPDEALLAVETIGRSGIGIFEITLTVPSAAQLIKELAIGSYLVGAGTVLTVEQARQCIDAGAQFIVSPIFDEEVVRFCANQNVSVMPSGLTPTEIYRAWQSGADCVKIFPCDAMGGAKYLKAVKSVFPHVRIMPTGGVSLASVGDMLKAGAFAVGVGTDLVNIDAIRAGNTDLLVENTKRFIQAVTESHDDFHPKTVS